MDAVERERYREINNVRFPGKPQRPIGTGNLSDQTKLAILQQKKLQIVSQSRIAKDFDVSRKTVNMLTEDNLSDEAKAEMQTFTEGLKKARGKVIKRINEKLDKDTFKDHVYPGLLTSVNNAYNIETQAPVDALSAANAILSLAQLCKIPDSDRDAFFASAAESFAVLKGVEVGLIVAAAREIEAKQLQPASVDIEVEIVDNDGAV